MTRTYIPGEVLVDGETWTDSKGTPWVVLHATQLAGAQVRNSDKGTKWVSWNPPRGWTLTKPLVKTN